MGILKTNEQTYYATGGDHGGYRYLSLQEVVDSFMATYVCKEKLCERVSNQDVVFHATRALQEFSYDIFRSINSWEIVVPDTLTAVLPRDFVNHVKLSWSDSEGIEHVLYPAIKTSNPTDIQQNSDGTYYTSGNNLVSDDTSDTWENYKSATPNENQQDDYNDDDYKHMRDERYGIEPEHAQINGSYFIDYANGKIHFGSTLSGRTLVLDYISDGMNAADSGGVPSGSAIVHKFAEEAMYKHILYGCLSAQAQPHPMLAMIKKERFAETRKAKIRLSNIKIEELAQIMRGGSKWIKH